MLTSVTTEIPQPCGCDIHVNLEFIPGKSLEWLRWRIFPKTLSLCLVSKTPGRKISSLCPWGSLPVPEELGCNPNVGHSAFLSSAIVFMKLQECCIFCGINLSLVFGCNLPWRFLSYWGEDGHGYNSYSLWWVGSWINWISHLHACPFFKGKSWLSRQMLVPQRAAVKMASGEGSDPACICVRFVGMDVCIMGLSDKVGKCEC